MAMIWIHGERDGRRLATMNECGMCCISCVYTHVQYNNASPCVSSAAGPMGRQLDQIRMEYNDRVLPCKFDIRDVEAEKLVATGRDRCWTSVLKAFRRRCMALCCSTSSPSFDGSLLAFYMCVGCASNRICSHRIYR